MFGDRIATGATGFRHVVARIDAGVPWHRPQDHAHMLEGLRKAGLPEG